MESGLLECASRHVGFLDESGMVNDVAHNVAQESFWDVDWDVNWGVDLLSARHYMGTLVLVLYDESVLLFLIV